MCCRRREIYEVHHVSTASEKKINGKPPPACADHWERTKVLTLTYTIVVHIVQKAGHTWLNRRKLFKFYWVGIRRKAIAENSAVNGIVKQLR